MARGACGMQNLALCGSYICRCFALLLPAAVSPHYQAWGLVLGCGTRNAPLCFSWLTPTSAPEKCSFQPYFGQNFPVKCPETPCLLHSRSAPGVLLLQLPAALTETVQQNSQKPNKSWKILEDILEDVAIYTGLLGRR